MPQDQKISIRPLRSTITAIIIIIAVIIVFFVYISYTLHVINAKLDGYVPILDTKIDLLTEGVNGLVIMQLRQLQERNKNKPVPEEKKITGQYENDEHFTFLRDGFLNLKK